MKTSVKFLLFSMVGVPILLGSCHLDGDFSEDEPLLHLVVTARDSATGSLLSNAAVRLITIADDTLYDTTDGNGQSEFPDIRSSRTAIKLTLSGYLPLDTLIVIDTVDSAAIDFESLVELHVRMIPLRAGDGEAHLVLRDPALNPLTLGIVTYADSSGDSITVVDEDSSGTISIPSLHLPGEYFKVEHPGYLGRYVLAASADSASDATLEVILLPLEQSLSGYISIISGVDTLPLTGARVVYVLDNNLAFPREFISLSDTSGLFQMNLLPLASGNLEYYLNASSTEPSAIVSISTSDLQLAGSVDDVVLGGSP